jgi:hypothetical protein
MRRLYPLREDRRGPPPVPPRAALAFWWTIWPLMSTILQYVTMAMVLAILIQAVQGVTASPTGVRLAATALELGSTILHAVQLGWVLVQALVGLLFKHWAFTLPGVVWLLPIAALGWERYHQRPPPPPAPSYRPSRRQKRGWTKHHKRQAKRHQAQQRGRGGCLRYGFHKSYPLKWRNSELYMVSGDSAGSKKGRRYMKTLANLDEKLRHELFNQRFASFLLICKIERRIISPLPESDKIENVA